MRGISTNIHRVPIAERGAGSCSARQLAAADRWRFWNDAHGFSQRFTHTFSDGGNAIHGQGELSRDDGATWQHDLAITYRKVA
jgi:hypothetical protein